MRLSIVAISLVLVLGIVGAGIFMLNSNNTVDDPQMLDTDSDGIANVNDTYIFDPDCSEDTDNDGICDAEEGSFDRGSDQALQIAVSTASNEYKTHEDFEVELQIDNLAKTTAKDLDYTVESVANLRDPRSKSEARGTLPTNSSTSAVFTTGFEGEAQENMQYNGIIQARATADYTTTARSSVELVAAENFEGESKEQLSTVNNGGPVVLEIATRSPVIVRGQNDTSFEIAGNLRNLGEGDITGFEDSDVEVNLGFPNVPESKQSECQKEVDLSLGSNSFVCSFDLSNETRGTMLTLDAELNYRYQASDETTVTLNSE